MKELPAQHVNVGIAEQNGAGVAAGLATCGKIPFVVTYAAFGSMRMCEMIRQEICYPNLNVKIACSHGGLTPADDGASHQAPEDMGILRTIPNMRVVMGADYWATRKLIREAAKIEGPVYLRFTKGPIKPVYDEDVELTIGKANMLKDGKDVAIIANGDTVNIAVSAAKMLEEKGISARVLDMHTIKPLDVEAVTDCLVNIGKVITVEDAYIINGLGSAVSEVCAGMGKGIVKRIGVQDWFGQSGPYDKLLEINGITKEEIVKTAEALLG
jgi:transketolase